MAMKLHKCKGYSITSLITWYIYMQRDIIVEHNKKEWRYLFKEEELAEEEK